MKRPGVLFFISVLFLVLQTAKGQDFTFVQFGQNEGLRHSQVLSISQDSNGNLWLGTATRSIYRFDGRSFHEYKISVPGYTGTLYAFNVQVDSENRIWVLTNIGLVYFDGVKSKLIPTNGDLRLGVGLDMFIDKDNNPWVVDLFGTVFSFSHDTLVSRDDIRQLAGGIVGHFENDGLTCFYSIENKMVGVDETGKVVALQTPWSTHDRSSFVYKDDETYLVGSLKGVTEFSERGGVGIATPVGGVQVTKMIRDKDGQIWGIANNHVFVIDGTKKLHWVSGSETLIGNDAIDLFRDKDGNVWISVDVIGIVKYKKHSWKKIPETEGMDVTCMIEKLDRTGVIYGTYNNGIVGLGKSVLNRRPITSFAYNPTNKALLASTLKEGAFEVNGTSARRIFPSKATNFDIHGITASRDKIVVGGNLGLYEITPTNVKIYSKKIAGVNLATSCPVVVNDSIFFGGSVSGVMKIAGDNIVDVGPPELRNSTVYTIRKQRSGDYVVTGEFSQVFFFDSNFRYKGALNFQNFASNVLLVEFIDSSHLIVGSNDGLFKVTVSNDSITSVKKYGKVDGYNGEELYAGSSLVTTNGSIVIGTVSGAYIFDQGNEEKSFPPPSAFLTSVDFSSRDSIKCTEGYFQLPVNPGLNHDQNNITFSFSSTSLSNPYNVQFKYKMEGLDNDWSALTTSQKITYSNLAPGKYTFNVQAISENRVWGNIAMYDFFVEPAFWQTLPFYVMISLVVSGIIVSIFYLITNSRIRKIKMREQVRTTESARLKKQMSMDFHDEMGNRLATLLTQASLLKVKHAGTDLFGIFDFFERHAHAIYHGTKDFIWSIDMESNNLREVISYLRDFGANYFEKNGINFHVSSQILSDDFNVFMPEGYNRNIILIFKEAMTNALKHSKASNVYFNASIEDGKYCVSFRDDGIGMTDMKNSGNGLKNMQLRASKINGTLVISKREIGVAIFLTLKIQNHEALQ